MQELRTKAEYLKASNADGTVILQATATWCSQCKAIAPAVDKLIAKYPEATFYKYDTDSAGDIAQELGVSQMPVFTIFHDGDLEDTVRGAKAKALEEAVGKVYKGKVVEELCVELVDRFIVSSSVSFKVNLDSLGLAP